MEQKPKSGFGKLNLKDLLHGSLLAASGASALIVQQSLDQGHIPSDPSSLKFAAMAGVGAGISYIIKKLLTNSKDELLKLESKETTPIQ